MRHNNHGFSLIELMAVLVISSIVLVPLLISFTDSLTINRQARDSRIAASVTEGALYAIEKIDFADYRTPLSTENTAGNYYLELNVNECATIFLNASDVAICQSIFNMTSSNMSFDATTFKIYLFDYSLTTAEHNALIADESIEPNVRSELANNADILAAMNGTDNQQLIWIILWLDYYDNPDLYMVATGIIANDDIT